MGKLLEDPRTKRQNDPVECNRHRPDPPEQCNTAEEVLEERLREQAKRHEQELAEHNHHMIDLSGSQSPLIFGSVSGGGGDGSGSGGGSASCGGMGSTPSTINRSGQALGGGASSAVEVESGGGEQTSEGSRLADMVEVEPERADEPSSEEDAGEDDDSEMAGVAEAPAIARDEHVHSQTDRSRHSRNCCLCQGSSGTFERRNYGGREYLVCGTCECSECGHAHHTSQGQFVPDCAHFAQEQDARTRNIERLCVM